MREPQNKKRLRREDRYFNQNYFCLQLNGPPGIEGVKGFVGG